MGATEWWHVVPIEASASAALRRLQLDVVHSGHHAGPRGLEEPPTTLDQALALFGEGGSHSVLDMVLGVRETPAPFVVSPVSSEDLASIAGSVQPTIDMLEANRYELMDLRQRWFGSYVVAYEDEQPVHYVFFGFSGD